MELENLFTVIFVFACVLTGIKGENCETYDGNNLCIEPCPEGTRFVSSDCMTPTLSQRTCQQPRARSLGIRCDYSRCDCIKPKVYDEATKTCVRLSECSGRTTVKSNGETK